MAESVFPLPFVGSFSGIRGTSGLCARMRRRLFSRNTVVGLLRRAVEVLNYCRFASLVRPSRRPVRQDSASPGSLQWTILGRLLRLCRNAGLPPRQSPREALCELLKVDDLVGDFSPTTVVPFEWSKLKLLRDTWQVMPMDITSIAPAEVGRCFTEPGFFRLGVEAAEEVAARTGPITPYWDVVLAANGRLRRQFMDTLRRKGLVGYRRKVFSFVGMFFVRKKDGQIRLVVDGRTTNARHKLPPHTSLGTVAAWAEIDLSSLPDGATLFKCSGDLQDSFYQFTSDVLAEDFAFDFPVRASDAGVTEVWEDGSWVALEPDDLV